LTKEQPNLAETFSCVAKLGHERLRPHGSSADAAMKPEMNAPGGCNAGFLRDDALLMVTFYRRLRLRLEGQPGSVGDRVLAAKGGDPGAVVMLSILDPDCPAPDRICELVKKFPVPHGCGQQPGLRRCVRGRDRSGRRGACAEFIPG
jgi:hypothetical protein